MRSARTGFAAKERTEGPLGQQSRFLRGKHDKALVVRSTRRDFRDGAALQGQHCLLDRELDRVFQDDPK